MLIVIVWTRPNHVLELAGKSNYFPLFEHVLELDDMTLFILAITEHNTLNYMNSITISDSNIYTRKARLLETKNGNTRRQEWFRKLDITISSQDGKT